MSTKTNIGLTQWMHNWLGQPYWYGTCCYDCTESLLRRKREQYPNHYASSRMDRYRADIKGGKRCADCIGVIKGYMWYNEATNASGYAINGCPDASANGMFEAAAVKDSIANLPEIPGLILWKTGHVGVYIGNGEIIEARGFNYGCVKTKLSTRGFTHWFKLPGCQYDGTEIQEYELGQRTLRKGYTGTDVRELQARLEKLGYDIGAYGVDGEFGTDTLAALKAFQSAHSLEPDGIYGSATHAQLITFSSSTDAPPTTQYAVVDASSLNLRTGPGTEFPVAAQLTRDTRLPFIDETKRGWLIVLHEGQLRFISARYSYVTEATA